MNDLTKNIDKVHTTEMGAERIKRNLGLNCDVVEWCKNEILKSSDITRTGKNWYVAASGAVLTVNAHSFTIITAHKSR